MHCALVTFEKCVETLNLRVVRVDDSCVSMSGWQLLGKVTSHVAMANSADSSFRPKPTPFEQYMYDYHRILTTDNVLMPPLAFVPRSEIEEVKGAESAKRRDSMVGKQLVGRLDRRDSVIQQEEEHAQMDQMQQVKNKP